MNVSPRNKSFTRNFSFYKGSVTPNGRSQDKKDLVRFALEEIQQGNQEMDYFEEKL